MDNTDKRKRLEESLRTIRTKAKEIEEDLQVAENLRKGDIKRQKELIAEAEDRLRYLRYILQKMENERWEQAQKRKSEGEAPADRKFFQATTSEEAEGETPSAEERSLNLLGKTKEEVLESGTLIEKIRLYVCYLDADSYLENKSKLTKEEISQITQSVKTKEDKIAVKYWFKEYDALCRFGEQLRFYFKRFQTCYSFLARLLNQWESYDKIARLYTDDLRNTYSEQTIEERLLSCNETELEDVAFKYNKRRNSIEADIYGEGGLYEKIRQEAKETAEALSDFKALAVAAELFIEHSQLKYTPISIDIPTLNAKEERYTRYLVRNPIYFRSELPQARTKTFERRKRAVIPDYYEVKPSADLLKDGKAALQSYMK